MTQDTIEDFARHVRGTRFEDLPSHTVDAARRFILDAIGVGLSGSRGQLAQELLGCAHGWGGAGPCRVLARTDRFPAPVAAMLNACQIHNSEFDSLHEKAVVHAMTGTLPAALAIADGRSGITGRQLIEAVVAGVDIACAVGLAARSPMKFFRPGVANGFGATAAAGKLLGLDEQQLVAAFGACVAQSCGSMQAHEEGSMLLSLQVGFNTRNALQACDLAAAGLKATQDVLDGRFGYFRLFEDVADPRPVVADFGRIWRMDEMSQKPFPSGRATHGAIEALMRIRGRRDFSGADVEGVVIDLTPVAKGLVGRPVKAGMEANYARLSLLYCAARVLGTGGLTMADFTPAALADETAHRLSERIAIGTLEGTGIDAFSPVAVRVSLKDGSLLEETVTNILGHPRNPLSEAAHLGKFRANCRSVEAYLRQGAADGLIEMIANLEDVANVRQIMDLVESPS
ncbi:MmgE/PrpD family protein [Arvimicrobium flavum]|uniref:MmgE/PrpD family protein n=1 Tax=Arvimicrobium flavum TaxID=3393320 RepID=UPI00237BC2EC|nr:MmgE/PrpD family protein [Mesorhizobium shangrilense]